MLTPGAFEVIFLSRSLGGWSCPKIRLGESSLVIALDAVIIGLLSPAPGLPGHRLSSSESKLLGNHLWMTPLGRSVLAYNAFPPGPWVQQYCFGPRLKCPCADALSRVWHNNPSGGTIGGPCLRGGVGGSLNPRCARDGKKGRAWGLGG